MTAQTGPALTVSKGTPCGAPTDGGTCGTWFGLCPDCGHCYSHCEHRRRHRDSARSRGGRTKARKQDIYLVERDALPEPKTLEDCAKRLGFLCVAVETGVLGERRADVSRACIRELKDILLRDQEDKIDELRKIVDRLKRDRKGR